MRQWWRGLVFGLVLMLGVAPVAGAQPAGANAHTVKLVYWPAAVSSSTGAAWNTGFWGLEYQFVQSDSPWGIHLRYLTGSQTNGTDTFWSADALYALDTTGGWVVRGILGYGSVSWVAPGPLPLTNSGVRIGFDAVKALQTTETGFSLHANFAWSPSGTGGAATEWTLGLVYKPAWPGAVTEESDYVPVALQPGGRWPTGPSNWRVELAYTDPFVDAGAAGTYTWSGLRFMVSKTF